MSFADHCRKDHHLWAYLNFTVYLREKCETEFTGPESYVAGQVEKGQLDWVPRLATLSLEGRESAEEHQKAAIAELQERLSATSAVVGSLTQQLLQLQANLAAQRRKAHRHEMHELGARSTPAAVR